MFQPALNLHLVCHTLHHTSFMHCLFVNLQIGTMEIITNLRLAASACYCGGALLARWLGLVTICHQQTVKHSDLICAALRDHKRPLGGN